MAAEGVTVQTNFRRAVPFLAIFLFAFSLRLIYVQGYKNHPLFAFPQVDAETYLTQAKQMRTAIFFKPTGIAFINRRFILSCLPCACILSPRTSIGFIFCK